MKLVIDQMQQQLSVPNRPMRIVSLVPSQTELLYYWGLGDRVVGITKFCIHPNEWYRNKRRVGGTKNVNFETIEALQPDLIIGNKEENSQADIEQLQKKYPVWMSDMQNMEQVWEMMLSLGELLNVEEKSHLLINRLQVDFRDLSEKKTTKRWKVAYFIWQNPFMVAASNTFIDTILNQGGFDNAFEEEGRYPVVTEEIIRTKEPELIFLSSEPYPFKEKHVANFQQICPKAQVEVVDGELFSWYGSRLLHTVDYIKKLRKKLEN